MSAELGLLRGPVRARRPPPQTCRTGGRSPPCDHPLLPRPGRGRRRLRQLEVLELVDEQLDERGRRGHLDGGHFDAASTTTSSSSAAGSSGACSQLLAASRPAVTPGSTPKLWALEHKALQGARTSAFQFTGRTCVATTSPAQVITLDGVASLHPNLVVDGHETIAGRHLEVRFIGSKIYIYLAEIAARDGGKPWLVADLKNLSSASGLDFGQLLDQVRQLSPNGPSPLLKAASAFHPLGKATIGGQTVYAYQGSFAPSDLTNLGLRADLAKQTATKCTSSGPPGSR